MLYRIAKPTISIGVYSKIATKRLFYEHRNSLLYNSIHTVITRKIERRRLESRYSRSNEHETHQLGSFNRPISLN